MHITLIGLGAVVGFLTAVGAAAMGYLFGRADERYYWETEELGRARAALVASELSSISTIVESVSHELEHGPASEGDSDAIAWCARVLRAIRDPCIAPPGAGVRNG